jgi:hypothetical protein
MLRVSSSIKEQNSGSRCWFCRLAMIWDSRMMMSWANHPATNKANLARHITETSRIQFTLFGMQNRAFGPHLAIIRMKSSGMSAVVESRRSVLHVPADTREV